MRPATSSYWAGSFCASGIRARFDGKKLPYPAHQKISLAAADTRFRLSLAYVYAYIRQVYWVWVLAGDITVSQCLIFASIFECCIQCGLIPSNLGYRELFEATSLPVQDHR